MANSDRESSTDGWNYSPTSASDDHDSVSAYDNTYTSSRVVFVVILACGLIANCALVIYIVRGQRRIGSREPPQLNLFLVAIHVATNVVNCLANGIWIIYTITSGQHSDAYTTLGCSFDAAAVQMIVISHAIGLALMSADRFISVRNARFAAEQRGFTVSRSALLIVVAWLCSFALSLPVVVPNGVDTEGNSQRYLCTMDSEAAPAYIWTTMVIGYVCPIVVVVAMLIGTAASTALRLRKLSSSQAYTSATGSGSPIAETGPIPAAAGRRNDPAANLAIEVNAAKYVACLFFLWFFFILPFAILSLVRIGRTASLPAKQRPFSYAKEADTIVTSLFVSFPVLVPVITYIWRENVCCRCVHRARTCCRESVSAAEVGTSSISPSVTPKRRQRVGDVHPFYITPARSGAFETGVSAGGRPVPVLFATPHGLHIRSSSASNGLLDHAADADRQIKSAEDGASGDDAQKCDVFGSVCALQNEDLLNTSDYDSGDEDGVGSDSGRSGCRLQRSVESRASPQSTSLLDSTASKTAWRSEKSSCIASRGIGDQPARRSTWYDDEESETQAETRVDRLVDSGVESTLKRCGNKTVNETSEMTEVPQCVTSQDQPPKSAAVRVTPISGSEPVVKPKKRVKNEDGRHSRRVADAETSEHVRKEGGGERQKSTKATSKSRESQNRRTDSGSMQPQHRDLPKIVVNDKARDGDVSGVEKIAQTSADARHVVHSNTDPSIATAMATLDDRSGGSSTGANNEEGTVRNPKARPLPPLGKRRRTASESCATNILSDTA